MLHDAARATLDLATALLEDGRGLKDATPRNILFRGSIPVFVDLLSVEERRATDPLWLPYAQFLRTFVIPLLVSRTGLPLRAIFNVGRDGIEPEAVRNLVPLSNRLHGPGLLHITLPTLLFAARPAADIGAPPKRTVPPDQARYVLGRLFKGLRRSIDAVTPTDSRSSWTEYREDHHTRAYFAAKESFVATSLEKLRPTRVIDVGCNTGDLSVVAARRGASVVAIDNDPHVIDRLFRRARKNKMDILPLVVDIASPTPPSGWANQEFPSFLERASGAFDCVLAMAVVHHLLATNGIPLTDVIDLLAQLTMNILLVEFVPPSDPLFTRLARGRDELYADLSRARFEEVCKRRFQIIEAQLLPSGERVAYVLRKHS